MTESPRLGQLVLDTELLERIAGGESLRSLAREIGVAHTTLSRRLKRPEVAAQRRAVQQRLRLDQKKQKRLEKEVRRRAREEAKRDRLLLDARRRPPPHRRSDFETWLDERDEPPGLLSTERMSINDELAAQTVAAGGGVQDLIEKTGLRTRQNVYESIDPQIVARALANDARRPPADRQDAGKFRRLKPDPALISRRAAGEPLRALAADEGVSHSTFSRYFALPEVAEELLLQQRALQEQRRNEAELDDQNREALTRIAARYTSKIPNVWCPIHNRRCYVRSVDASGSATRLEVVGCCPEAANELFRWLEIYRPVLPAGS